MAFTGIVFNVLLLCRAFESHIHFSDEIMPFIVSTSLILLNFDD